MGLKWDRFLKTLENNTSCVEGDVFQDGCLQGFSMRAETNVLTLTKCRAVFPLPQKKKKREKRVLDEMNLF